MKIRFTWGNVLGLLTATAGLVVNNSTTIAALSPIGGGKLIAGAALILGVTKGVLSHNSDQIPTENKVEAGPLVLERTGPLKPQTP